MKQHGRGPGIQWGLSWDILTQDGGRLWLMRAGGGDFLTFSCSKCSETEKLHYFAPGGMPLMG